MFRSYAHMCVCRSPVRRAPVRSWTRSVILFSAALAPFGIVLDPVGGQTAPAPAKAVLYENDAANPNGAVGTVTWRTEQVAPAPGKKPEIVVHADIDIPQKLTVHWSIQRNDDREMPASHIIRIQFVVPPGSAHRSVINVPALFVKSGERQSEARLTGMTVKVRDNFFLIGLTGVELDKKRNIEWLQERPWVDVPFMFADAKQAIVSFDEGAEGKRILAAAFAAWGEAKR